MRLRVRVRVRAAHADAPMRVLDEVAGWGKAERRRREESSGAEVDLNFDVVQMGFMSSYVAMRHIADSSSTWSLLMS